MCNSCCQCWDDSCLVCWILGCAAGGPSTVFLLFEFICQSASSCSSICCKCFIWPTTTSIFSTGILATDICAAGEISNHYFMRKFHFSRFFWLCGIAFFTLLMWMHYSLWFTATYSCFCARRLCKHCYIWRSSCSCTTQCSATTAGGLVSASICPGSSAGRPFTRHLWSNFHWCDFTPGYWGWFSQFNFTIWGSVWGSLSFPECQSAGIITSLPGSFFTTKIWVI